MIAAVKAQLELVAPGDRPLGDQIELLDTAGHTAGHMSVLVDGGNESLLVAGDLVHNQAFSLARPRWTTGFDWDLRRCVEARLRIGCLAVAERAGIVEGEAAVGKDRAHDAHASRRSRASHA